MVTILLHTDHVLAVAKPAGVPTDRTRDPARRSLVGDVHAWWRDVGRGGDAPALMHRLDVDTTGVVLFGLGKAGRRALTDAFRDRTARKTYVALVEADDVRGRAGWQVRNRLDVIEGGRGNRRARIGAVPKGGQLAITDFEVAQSHAGTVNGTPVALVRARPATGRRHQIRAHLAEDGAPIIGDAHYGSRVDAPRFYLHASSIEVPDPAGDGTLRIDAPLPADWPV